MNNSCHNIRSTLNIKGELTTACHKHYCYCQDKYLFDDDLNKRYHKAKKQNKARFGIFLKQK